MGDTLHRRGWNLARMRGPKVVEGPLLLAKFHPRWCNDNGIGPPQLKFLLRFDQNVEYKRPTGAYPLHDFHKIYRVCTSFQDALADVISLDLLKGYGIMGVLSWRGLVTPKSSAPDSGETVRQTAKSFRGTRTCSRSFITMPSLVGLRFHPPPWQPKTLSFFSVCLSVCSSRSMVTLASVKLTSGARVAAA